MECPTDLRSTSLSCIFDDDEDVDNDDEDVDHLSSDVKLLLPGSEACKQDQGGEVP